MEENNFPKDEFMSERINELSTALSSFQTAIKQPTLNKEVKVNTKNGRSYNFKYADLSACVKAAQPELEKNGLAVTQIVNGNRLITLLTHSSGQWFKSVMNIGGADYQALGSAITYCKRYSYCAIIGIVADADDDANFACGNTAEFKEKPNGNAAYTGATIKKALEELEAAKSEQDYKDVWEKYREQYPAMCNQGTEFFNACVAKALKLKQ